MLANKIKRGMLLSDNGQRVLHRIMFLYLVLDIKPSDDDNPEHIDVEVLRCNTMNKSQWKLRLEYPLEYYNLQCVSEHVSL